MAYTTPTATSAFMVGVTLDSNSTTLLTRCITWAENEINEKLARRYDVSAFSTTTPPTIVSLAEEMALGQFYTHNSRGGKEALARGQTLIKGARERLLALSKGAMDLVNSSGGIVAERSTRGVLSSTVDYDSTFAEDDELNWRVDPDKLDDLSDTRE